MLRQLHHHWHPGALFLLWWTSSICLWRGREPCWSWKVRSVGLGEPDPYGQQLDLHFSVYHGGGEGGAQICCRNIRINFLFSKLSREKLLSRKAAWERVTRTRTDIWRTGSKNSSRHKSYIHTLCRTWYMFRVRMSLMDSTSSGESLLVSCVLWALETSLEGSQALFFHLGKTTTKPSIYF